MASEIQQAAAQLFDLIPPGMPSSILEEYGLDLSPEQAQSITREILGLCLYWIGSGVRVSFTEAIRSQIMEELLKGIRDNWEAAFQLEAHAVEEFFQEQKAKESVYKEIVQQRGEPIAVLSQSVADLEAKGTIETHDQQKLLALLVDTIPVEEIGEVSAEIEATFS